MPIYEYRCTKCDHEMEVMQKITDRPKRKCPECAGKLEKLISRTSFQLKGGGWFDSGYSDKTKSSPSKSSSTSTDSSKSKKKDSGSGGSDSSGSGKMKAASA